MEAKFLAAWGRSRETAQKLGVRFRPEALTVELARKQLSTGRDSDGFAQLAQKGRLDLSLEALSVHKAYTALFTDEQVNAALQRLLEENYRF